MTFIELKLRPAYKGKNALWSAHKLRSSSTLQYLPLFTFLLSEDTKLSLELLRHTDRVEQDCSELKKRS